VKSYYALAEADIAVHYLQAKSGVKLPGTAQALVADVEAYLRRSGLDHRLSEAVDIAIAAHEIAQQVQAQSAPAPSEVEAAFQNDQREGVGDRRPDLELANYVAGLDMNQFAAERQRPGTTKGTAAFLLGL
jgi:hypothetical protein